MEMKDSGCHIVNEKLVEEAKAGISNRAELDYLSELFKLLSDPTRMKLVLALSCGEMCVCDLGAALGMTKSAISHQLKTMKQCSVVKSRREGKMFLQSSRPAYDRYYSPCGMPCRPCPTGFRGRLMRFIFPEKKTRLRGICL